MTDPQQRIMLEISQETLTTMRETKASEPMQTSKVFREGSGKEDSNCGVFCGVSYNEYAQALRSAQADVSPYTATGGSLSVVPGKLLGCFQRLFTPISATKGILLKQKGFQGRGPRGPGPQHVTSKTGFVMITWIRVPSRSLLHC